MGRRADPGGELAGQRLFGFFARRLAECDVIFDALGKGASEFVHRAALEGDRLADVDHSSVKQTGVVVVLDRRFVPLWRIIVMARSPPRSESA